MKLDPIIERAARAAFAETFRFFDPEQDSEPRDSVDEFIRTLTRELEIENRNANRKTAGAREAQ